MKYAIKIPFGNVDDEESWIYVMEPDDTDGKFDNIHVVTYNTIEKAEAAASAWRDYKIVEYDNEGKD